VATKVKAFTSTLLRPLPVPNGMSLEEQINVFLATLLDKNVVTVVTSTAIGSQHGTITHTGLVLFRV
jgi:hypothetical protein